MTLCFMAMLAVHVTGRTIALLAGPVAMPAPKGPTLHRRAGRAYAVAMGCTALSALCPALATANRLLVIAVLNGWRALGQKRLHQRLGTRWFDWLLSAPTLLFSAALLLAGLRRAWWRCSSAPAAAPSPRARCDCCRAGSRPAAGCCATWPTWAAPASATVTPFAVVTLTVLPPPVAFIVPTLVGTPIIARIAARVALASRGLAGPDTALREAGGRPGRSGSVNGVHGLRNFSTMLSPSPTAA